jgi:pimeloyl-ACP methyl ester carboxylesterase
MRNLTQRYLSIATLVLAGCLNAPDSEADSVIGLTEKGAGPALVFIPGLNSGSEIFSETCAAFVTTHTCLLLDLPGFAGQEPVDVSQGFLMPMRDAVISLLREKDVADATLVGHSLGGNIAMMVALQAPELVEQRHDAKRGAPRAIAGEDESQRPRDDHRGNARHADDGLAGRHRWTRAACTSARLLGSLRAVRFDAGKYKRHIYHAIFRCAKRRYPDVGDGLSFSHLG